MALLVASGRRDQEDMEPMSEPEQSDVKATNSGAGREPEVQTTLANERTYLAWLRTAMALVASGIAV